MILQANIDEALKSLISAKQRSLLALIGIIIGIGSVIGMMSIGEIVENQTLKQFEDMGINIITVTKDFQSPNKKASFPLPDTLSITRYIPGISNVAPYITSGTQFSYGNKQTDINMMGVTESFFDINKLIIREGRQIYDLDSYRYFCVIGPELADFLKKSGVQTCSGRSLHSGGVCTRS